MKVVTHVAEIDPKPEPLFLSHAIVRARDNGTVCLLLSLLEKYG